MKDCIYLYIDLVELLLFKVKQIVAREIHLRFLQNCLHNNSSSALPKCRTTLLKHIFFLLSLLPFLVAVIATEIGLGP